MEENNKKRQLQRAVLFLRPGCMFVGYCRRPWLGDIFQLF